jgi:hypothetical protein
LISSPTKLVVVEVEEDDKFRVVVVDVCGSQTLVEEVVELDSLVLEELRQACCSIS